MGQGTFSKVKLLKIWEILIQESDGKYPLSMNQIIERLERGGISYGSFILPTIFFREVCCA